MKSLVSTAALSALLLSTATVSAQEPQDRTHDYVMSLVGPGALVSIGLTAGYDQARNEPPSWGRSGSGFGKRVASAAGSRFANQSVRHGLAAIMDRSTTYRRCSCTSFPARVGHAVIGAITDTNANGKRLLSEPAIAGAVAGAYAPLLWRPSYSSSDAAAGIGISLGMSALGNIVHEFVLH